MFRKIFGAVFAVLVLTALAACGIETTAPVTTASTATTVTTASTAATTSATATTQTTAVVTTVRQFTLTELALYDGDGGTDAYIAVNGIVYDVTDAPEWSNGWHKGTHYAGTDCTVAFGNSPHSLAFLNQLPIVGELAD